MNSKLNLIKESKGIGLIEILIVGAIISIAFVGLVSFLISSRGITFQIARNTEAVALAEEGMEAVRSMRDESWSSNISVLASGTTYYPEISGNKWTLSTIDPGPSNGLYTRTVTFENVNRDSVTDDVASSGTLDPNTKKLTVVVTWAENQVTKDVTLTTYITNFLSN